MKTWHIILIFAVVAILGMFIYLNSQKKKREEETKQLALLQQSQAGLLAQANQSGLLGGFVSGGSTLLGSASSALQQNPGLISFLGTLV